MGRRKSKVQRLPPSERTVIGSKVLIFDHPPHNFSSSAHPNQVSQDIPTTLRLAEAADTVPSPAFARMHLSEQRPERRVELDDDTLRKVLRHAGPMAVMTASRVCRRWRRISLAILDEMSHVDLSATVRRSILSDLTYRSVLRMANCFPNMTHLSLRNFPHTDVLPSVAGFVMTHLRSTTLRVADFSALDFSASDVVGFLDACPQLSALNLTRTEAVTTGVLQTLVDALLRMDRTLDFLDISNCDRVDSFGLEELITRGRVREVKAASCRNIRFVDGGILTAPLTVETLKLQNCKNLENFDVWGGALKHLNLSQCSLLSLLRLKSAAPNASLELRTLNLALCSSLQYVSFGRSEVEHEYVDMETPFALSKLEDLLLSGTRVLRSADIGRAFGIDRGACVMPRLARLGVMGCQIEELRLRGYTNLERVDCSGCSHLNVVEISDSWNIAFVNLSSQHAPMGRVQIVLPSKANILGLRQSWMWEATDSIQSITYGA